MLSLRVVIAPEKYKAPKTLWESWAAEMKPLRLRFYIGMRSFELLSGGPRFIKSLSNRKSATLR
jgi:hypothetical protein